jgi:hypothetical protein
MNLSVIIPTKEFLVKREFEHNNEYYYNVYGKGGNAIEDLEKVSLWGTVIYELWEEEEIYEDLLYRIKVLTADITCALYDEDFSKNTQDKLQAEKKRVSEGIKILSRSRPLGQLYQELKKCLEKCKDYVKIRNTK